MAKRKVEFEGRWMHQALMLIPTIVLFDLYTGIGIDFAWLCFCFSINIVKNHDDKYYATHFNGKNTIKVEEIKTKENGKKDEWMDFD